MHCQMRLSLARYHASAKLTLQCIATVLMVSGTVAQTKPSSRPKECLLSNVTEQALHRVIYNYPTWQRPVRNVSETVYVNITFALSSVNDVIESDKKVKLTGYLSIRWFDQLRVWNNSFPLNCIASVVVPSETVWLPDVAMMNGDGRYILMNAIGEKVRIHSDGFTIYSPGGTFILYCEFNFGLFPFDVQLCPLKFESWRYTHNFMAFSFGKPYIKIFQWLENEQWELTHTSQSLISLSYMEPENSFDRVEFYFCLRRKAQYYITSVIAPGLIIAVCQIAVFALPLEDSNKINILFTSLLAYLVFLLMIASDMPRSSQQVPLLTTYVCVNMSLIAFSILGEGLTFVFAERSNSVHPNGPGFVPPCLRATSQAIARFMRLHVYFPAHPAPGYFPAIQVDKSFGSQASVSEDTNESQTTNESSFDIPYSAATWNNRQKAKEINIARKQWRYVACVTDRLTLLIYTIAVILAPIILFGVIPKFGYASVCSSQVDSA